MAISPITVTNILEYDAINSLAFGKTLAILFKYLCDCDRNCLIAPAASDYNAEKKSFNYQIFQPLLTPKKGTTDITYKNLYCREISKALQRLNPGHRSRLFRHKFDSQDDMTACNGFLSDITLLLSTYLDKKIDIVTLQQDHLCEIIDACIKIAYLSYVDRSSPFINSEYADINGYMCTACHRNISQSEYEKEHYVCPKCSSKIRERTLLGNDACEYFCDSCSMSFNAEVLKKSCPECQQPYVKILPNDDESFKKFDQEKRIRLCESLSKNIVNNLNSHKSDNYSWLYSLLEKETFDKNTHMLDTICLEEVLSIILICSLNLRPEDTTTYKKIIYAHFSIEEEEDVVADSAVTSISIESSKKPQTLPTKAPESMIGAKIKENQELEELTQELETIIAKIHDMLAEYDQFSFESAEIEMAIKKTLNAVERAEKIINKATVQGKTTELANLKALYDRQSSRLQSLSAQFTQNRSN